MSIVGNGPTHPSREVVLECFAPAPNGRLVGCMLIAIRTSHRVLRRDAREEVAPLRPDRMSLAVRLAIDVAPSPTAPIGPAIGVQSVVDQTQERRCIALHDEDKFGIYLPKRPFAADVSVQPLIRHGRQVRAGTIPIVDVTANSGPGGVIVFAPRLG